MAGIHVYGATAEITLGNTASWKTLLAYQQAANLRSRIRSWGGYPMGTVNSDPHVRLRIIKGTTMGTGGATVTPQVTNGVAEPAGGTWKDASTAFSVEPAATGQPLDLKPAHPQGGGTEWPSVDPNERFLGSNEILLLQYLNNGGSTTLKVTADLGLEQ